jgi:hypothetical protein
LDDCFNTCAKPEPRGIRGNFDSGDVGVGDDLGSLPVDVGGLGETLDVDLPV